VTLDSGPVAGVLASQYLGGVIGKKHIIATDMGGTSFDVGLVWDGAPVASYQSVVHQYEYFVPRIDIRSIGSGGGSVVWIDEVSGTMRVGPLSAGAQPGPACYGRGGTQPTVTDADLICGFLNAGYFLGGKQKLDAKASHAALETHIANPLKMTVLDAAAGIRRIVDVRMADEVRVFAAKRGVDLSSFTLLPFGGAGAVHAAAVADELGMTRILVPPRPGAFSALGLLCTDVVHDYIRSELRALGDIDPSHAEAAFAQLEAKARHELAAEGMDAGQASFARELDLRYTGQGYELRTPLDGLYAGALTQDALAAARERFDERHTKIHGHAAKERPVELVSYRLRLRVPVPKYVAREEKVPAAPPAASAAIKGKRGVHFDGKTAIETTLYERDRLVPGATLTGPAIVEQFDATTVIPPGWTARVDGLRNLILERV
jgi:N-methylhydantoinase A